MMMHNWTGLISPTTVPQGGEFQDERGGRFVSAIIFFFFFYCHSHCHLIWVRLLVLARFLVLAPPACGAIEPDLLAVNA